MCTIKILKEMTDKVVDRCRNFGILDFGIFKICLVSFGMLLGIYTYHTSKTMKPLIWVTFLITYMYLVNKIVFEGFKESGNK